MTSPLIVSANPEFAAWAQRIPMTAQETLVHFARDRRDMNVDLTGVGPIFTNVTVALPDPSLGLHDRVVAVVDRLRPYLYERAVPNTWVNQIGAAIAVTVSEPADLARWVVIDDTVVSVSERVFRNPGTHATHCCTRHGCKYGPSIDCAVLAGAVEQEFPCEQCGEPEEIPSAQIVALRAAIEQAIAGGTPVPVEFQALLDAAQAVVANVPQAGKFDSYVDPYAD